MARLSLYLFGAPRVEVDGTPISIGHSKGVALLAPLRDWFTEGFERPEYRQASAMLVAVDRRSEGYWRRDRRSPW